MCPCRRVFHLKESVVWRQQSNEKRSRNIGKIIAMFGSRLLATCGCWFLWDFSFYGNKGKLPQRSGYSPCVMLAALPCIPSQEFRCDVMHPVLFHVRIFTYASLMRSHVARSLSSPVLHSCVHTLPGLYLHLCFTHAPTCCQAMVHCALAAAVSCCHLLSFC